MVKDKLISSIGPVVQLAFVPDDFEGAVAHWTSVVGVGPFYWIEHAGLENMRFNGAVSDVDFGLALAYWGDIQIELIKQHNASPSIYNSAPYASSGLHHVCLMTDDIAASRDIATSAGGQIAFEADVPGGGAVFYADIGGNGGLVEVLQAAPGADGLFDMIKAASVDWDGSDPFRPLG